MFIIDAVREGLSSASTLYADFAYSPREDLPALRSGWGMEWEEEEVEEGEEWETGVVMQNKKFFKVKMSTLKKKKKHLCR